MIFFYTQMAVDLGGDLDIGPFTSSQAHEFFE
jgi:hypothetical protein